MRAIIQYLAEAGFTTMPESYYTAIDDWQSWYSLSETDFHNIGFYNGIANVKRTLAQLGMAKTVCEDWASLLMNEKVTITVGDAGLNDAVHDVLAANAFHKNMNRLVELYMAMGTGAVVEYLSNGDVKCDYIRADMIYPLSWDASGITECAFGTYGHDADGDFISLQIHVKGEDGNYEVHNRCLALGGGGDSYKEKPLTDGVLDVYRTGSPIPLFQIVSPNIVNNIDLDSPMGIAVFANAIDVLKEIDLTFDNFKIEVETGRRMVFLSAEMFFADADGNMHNVIGEKESVLRFVGSSEDENKLIHDYTPDLRIDQLKEALQFQLNLLSEKCGMGTNRYEFTPGGAKTATEVISEDSDLYQTLKKHEITLEACLRGMIKAIVLLLGRGEVSDDEISVTFDDSIIIDKQQEQQTAMQEVASGLLDPVVYRMKIYGESREEAMQNLNADENLVEENSPLRNV